MKAKTTLKEKLYLLNAKSPFMGVLLPPHTFFVLGDQLLKRGDPYFAEMIEVRTNSEYIALDFNVSGQFWRFAFLAALIVQESLVAITNPSHPYYSSMPTRSPLFIIPTSSNETRLEWDVISDHEIDLNSMISENIMLTFEVLIQLGLTTRFRLFLQLEQFHILSQYTLTYYYDLDED